MKFNFYKMQPLKTLFTTASLLFFSILYAQPPVKNYSAEWKKVDDLIQKQNLPKTALAEVKKIYALAKKEKQDAQVVKAVVYMSTLQQQTREDNPQASVKEIEQEIATSNEPVRSVLKSILADLYWNYLQMNRWKFYGRTNTVDFNKNDIATWTLSDLHNKISQLFRESIANKNILQRTSLQPFDAIIQKGNVRHLRPTLYDLLAHEALGYFRNRERDISRPAYAFEIDQAEAFAPAAVFARHRFTTVDTSSHHYHALQIFQELISFHLNDQRPDALIDADIERLVFVYGHSVHADKRELYRKALQEVANRFGDLPAASKAWFLVAQELKIDGDSYSSNGDTTHRFAKLKAKEILERIVAQKDSSEGKMHAINLLNELKNVFLNFSVEKVNIPNSPFRSLIHYKNLSRVNLRIIKPSEALKNRLNEYFDDDAWKDILAISPLRSWAQTLPATNDMQQHAVEIKIDALPAGDYMLIASSGDFGRKDVIGARMFYVSNISFVNQGQDHFVLHRETGQPLTNATVQEWQQTYDYNTRKYSYEKGKAYKTDQNGFFKMDERKPDSRRPENYKLDITWNGERFYMNDWIYDPYYYYDPSRISAPRYSAYLFTDRSIYRPAQTVYFKAIAITNEGPAKNQVLADKKVKVYLRDPNYQNIDSLELTTNEFGSINGTFKLRQGGLNGQFSIYISEKIGQETHVPGEVGFSVEDYKRPKFEVVYEPITTSYKVDQLIRITGTAKAYAGNNIDNANVNYRVIRQARFPYPWMFRGWWPPSAPQEIAHGTVKTDADGKFVISFNAIPDRTVDRKYEPVFEYRVYADVTDINGETRSAESVVSAGYKSIILDIQLPNSLPTDSLRRLLLTTTNLNGEHVPSTVNVKMYGLNDEKRLIRPRYWQRPDQFVMSKEEYIRLFPNDEYFNENDPSTWTRRALAFEITDSSRKNGVLPINRPAFEPGWYAMEVVAKDKDGADVKVVRYVLLFDERSLAPTGTVYLSTSPSDPIEPGETTSKLVQTSAFNVFLVKQVSRISEAGREQFANKLANTYTFDILNNQKKRYDFTATEADRGGYGANFFFVKHNRFFYHGDVIQVPWTNKDLTIEYSTFRDKTLPGSEERWTVKISGYKKDAVAAEMLAGMYDASLDQFRPHQWNKPQIWPVYSNMRQWSWITNFADVDAQLRRLDPSAVSVNKIYDQLIDIGNMYGTGEVRFMRLPKGANVEGAPAVDAVTVQASTQKDQAQVGNAEEADSASKPLPPPPPPVSENQIRRNFNETALFFPQLKTDTSGSITFSFTMPEALTRWKFQTIAHTKDLAIGYSSKEIITQKDLMVQPNVPRFFREGDKLEFSAKVVNMTDKEITGQAQLLLFDATTNQPVDGWFRNAFPNQYFTVAAKGSEVVNFPIDVPYQFNKALVWRVVARAGNVSDGEEAFMPVLTNRTLVTETLPINMRGTGIKQFTFDKLINSTGSETIQHHAITVEYSSNPAWYAVQALPYLMEYPHESAEMIWNRYYANAIASHIVKRIPRIKEIFESWKGKDTAALLSNLQKNEELKNVLLEETPWVLQAKNEEQQKKNIALLFDLVRMSSELSAAAEKLKQMQGPNGGFVWFKGGPDDRYITQYIVTGIGHLEKITGTKRIGELQNILMPALKYLDQRIKEDYDRLVKNKADLKKQQTGYIEVQYLYMRSFFPEVVIPKASQTAYNYYRNQMKQFWMKMNKYSQGMIALALHRTNDKTTPAAILR